MLRPLRQVSAWKFKPAEKDGRPVDVKIAIEVDFHLY
jgi:outer membrane biosynthesis protein TonB